MLFVLTLNCLQPVAGQAVREKMEKLMDYYVSHDHFNGTVLFVQHGAVLFAGGYGYSNNAGKTRNTENTMYQLGANTMPFTAEAILQLDSKGRLGLEDRVNKYLPDFPNGDRISIKNLLTHTSGLVDYTLDSLIWIAHPERQASRETILSIFQNQPLEFAPGSRFGFSYSNYFLLGMLIEHISHRKYEAELKEYMLHVCAMSHSGFDFIHLRDPEKAVGYRLEPDGSQVPTKITDSTVTYSAGSLYSSAADILKWHRALIHHRLLPKDWQDLAFTPVKNNYALGWQMTDLYGRHFMEHSGALPGFSSYLAREEKDDILLVVLENCTRTGATDKEIAAALMGAIYEKKVAAAPVKKARVPIEQQRPEAETPHKIPKTTLEKYAGRFEITPAYTLTFRLKGNELTGLSSDNQSFELIPESDHMFRAAGVNAEIEFVKDAQGRVNRIVLHQQDELIPGVRAR